MNILVKRLAALLITALAFSNVLYCQSETEPLQYESAKKNEDSKYLIGLSLGLTDFHEKDQYILPNVYQGTLFSSLIFFRINELFGRHEADLGFSQGSPAGQMNKQKLTEESGFLSYSYLRRLGKIDFIGNKLEFLLGGGISSFLMNTDVVTSTSVSPLNSSDQSWYWSHSINLLLEGEYIITEQSTILARLHMPVFRNVSRPENGHWLNKRNSRIMTDSFLHAAEGGRPEYIWSNFVIQGELEYSKSVGKWLDLKAQYLFSYASSEKPFSMGMYMNHFLIGAGYRF